MRIVRGVWRVLVGIKDALVLLLMLAFFGTIYAALSARPNAALPGSGALLVRLNGALVEQPSDADAFSLLSGNGSTTRDYRLRDVVRALRLAATDAAVKVVVLDLDSFRGGGQAAIAEAGAAVDEVRRAGKPVLAYATGYGDDGYQLAAHASEVWLNPLGAVLIAGPGRSQLYYKGLLDRLGVTTHVYRVGKFKSAVEPFTRADQSPEARQAAQALADSLFESWKDEIARARPNARVAPYAADPIAAVRAGGGDDGQAALVAHLVDKLGDRIAFGRRVAVLAGDAGTGRAGDFATLPLARYLAAHPETQGRVGVLTIAGDIVDGRAGPGAAGGDTVAAVLLDELRRGRIRALVVRVDSPGGSAAASERIRSAILEARGLGLPIVVSMGSLAASGGYWVTTPATTIFAEPSTITGSIGVFGILPSFEGGLAKIGLAADGVATTPLSGQPDPLRGTNPTIDALLQSGVERFYQRFLGIVATARHKTPEQVDAIGQGRVWAGGTARQIGLVDRFGTLDDAVAFAGHVAGLSGDDRAPRWIEREPSAFKAFLRGLMTRPDADPAGEGADAATDPWSRLAATPDALLAQAVGEARRLSAGPAIQARCLECAGTPPRPAPGAGDAGLARLLLARVGL